jgi:hypothetical protein
MEADRPGQLSWPNFPSNAHFMPGSQRTEIIEIVPMIP